MPQTLQAGTSELQGTAPFPAGARLWEYERASVSYTRLRFDDPQGLSVMLESLGITAEGRVVIQIPAGFNRTQNAEAAVRLAAAVSVCQPACRLWIAVRIDDQELERAGLRRDEACIYSGYLDLARAAEKAGLAHVPVKALVQKLCNSELEARHALSPGQEGLPDYTHLLLPTHNQLLGLRLTGGLRREAAVHPELAGKTIAVLLHPEPCSPKVTVSEAVSLVAQTGVEILLGDQVWQDVLNRRGLPGRLYAWAQRAKLALLGSGTPQGE